MSGIHYGIKVFADGADLKNIAEMSRMPWISGFTTNPTLMRKAGVTDYVQFAREVLTLVPDRPVSFEVFADDFTTMEAQAMEIASWGRNVNVKIPITNTLGDSSVDLIGRLSQRGVVCNVTAMFTVDQVRKVVEVLDQTTPAILSVFAGRIADTGVDPEPIMAEALLVMRQRPFAELLWASPREVLNVMQAEKLGCHIITATNDILRKLSLAGKDLEVFSLETVEMFRSDAVRAGYNIAVPTVVFA